MNKISSQMIKLKKQNLTFKEKIKNMKIFISESLRESGDIENSLAKMHTGETLISTKFILRNLSSKPGNYNSLRDSGNIHDSSTASMNHLKRDSEIKDLINAIQNKNEQLEFIKAEEKRRDNELKQMRTLLRMKDEEIEGLKQLSGQVPDVDKFKGMLETSHLKIENLTQAIEEKKEELDKLVELLSSKDEKLKKVTKLLEEKSSKLNLMSSQISIKDQELKDFRDKIVVKNESLENLGKALEQKKKEIDQLCQDLLTKGKEINRLNIILSEKNIGADDEERNSTIYTAQSTDSKPVGGGEDPDGIFSKMSSLNRLFDNKLKALEAKLDHKEMEGSNLKTQVKEKQAEIEDLMDQLEKAQARNDKLRDQLKDKDMAVQILESEHKASAKKLGDHIKAKEIEYTKLRDSSRKKDEECKMLRQEVDDLKKTLKHAQSGQEAFQKELGALRGKLEAKQGELEVATEALKTQTEDTNTANREEFYSMKENLQSLESEIKRYKTKEKKMRKLEENLIAKDQIAEKLRSEVSEMKAEFSNMMDRVREESEKQIGKLKRDNTELKTEISDLLEQKEELRNHLKEKLGDAERFRRQIEELEGDFEAKLAEKQQNFDNYVSRTKIKLIKKLRSLLDVHLDLKDQILFLKSFCTQSSFDLKQELMEGDAGVRRHVLKVENDLKRLRASSDAGKAAEQPELKAHVSKSSQASQSQGSQTEKTSEQLNNSNLESSSSSQDSKKKLQIQVEIQLRKQIEEKDQEIEDLHSLLVEQKENNRKLQDMNYASEDLSVTTEAQYVSNPGELEQEVQSMRRERDRLKHENFSLQSDVDELEEDKERAIQEIEDHENHLDELKSHIQQLDNHRVTLERNLEIMTLKGQALEDDLRHGSELRTKTSDECMKLKLQLDQMQCIIKELRKFKTRDPDVEQEAAFKDDSFGPSGEEESEEADIKTNEIGKSNDSMLGYLSTTSALNEILAYRPKLPNGAENKIQLEIEGDSLKMIVELMNNFLEFVKTRCQIVYDEYDAYHEILARVYEMSSKNAELEGKLEALMEESSTSSIYKTLLSGSQFIVIFRNLITKALIDLANMVNDKIMRRREMLLCQKDEVQALYDEYIAVVLGQDEQVLPQLAQPQGDGEDGLPPDAIDEEEAGDGEEEKDEEDSDE